MKKLLFLLLLSGVALGQTSTQNKITFFAGETFRPSVTLRGITATRFEVTFKNSIGGQVFKFSTLDSTITQLNDSTFTFAITDQMSLGKEGRGTWQMEVRSSTLGVKKSPLFAYEIYKATTNAPTGTAVQPPNYDKLILYDFTPVTPTVSVIYSGITYIDGVAISGVLALKQDISTLSASVRAVTLTGLSTTSSAAVTSSSTVLGALGQLQAQVSDRMQKPLRFTTLSIATAAVSGLTTDVIIKVYADGANNGKYYWDADAQTLEFILTL